MSDFFCMGAGIVLVGRLSENYIRRRPLIYHFHKFIPGMIVFGSIVCLADYVRLNNTEKLY